ncbi:MAG: 16S rRNA (guanine(966)-N(2))-methyltransferase RsmD [Gammaproteobacteria bacterium]|nr:16S rRNA (guanine(966)-N(2))-methyltransferase RsmD [Gammaproteobacteria bacterium]
MSKQLRKNIEQGELKIIGGQWRSRKISFPAVHGLRPSPSRIRETLFSWLIPTLPASNCLDLFAGSGALGFEALSRGANRVTMVEQNQLVVRQLLTNKELLNADGLNVLKMDARSLSKIDGCFDIVFCDPPFNQGIAQPLIEDLHKSKLLKPSARLYLETEKNLTTLSLPNNWTLLKEKTAGDVRYRLIDVGER